MSDVPAFTVPRHVMAGLMLFMLLMTPLFIPIMIFVCLAQKIPLRAMAHGIGECMAYAALGRGEYINAKRVAS